MANGPEKESDAEILRQMALYYAPVVTAKKLSEQLSITPQAVNKRLNRFEDEGWVDREKVGSRAVVWWLTDEGRQKIQ
jgi:DNA-binding MarR family transcriptional regulator